MRRKDWWLLAAIFAAWWLMTRLIGSGSLCYFRNLTGLPCPGCGLTHAGTALLRGEWAAAWRFHPGIYLLPVAIAIFFLLKNTRAKSVFCIALATAFIGYYLWRMAVYFPGGPYPMVWGRRSWFGMLAGFF